ncbi:pyruvate kinase [Babesia microti strain RI]|uniref:Pyruvate kinase n=1 Tax=Babesia microti (strain RI) TaxID=1133968 RepID=A0A1N6LXR4_BABMR|nr:pyruvate kinase [Babesia microti strain RI]SIO73652.1 pyruvate kinase [Babesia microti strain RI]|eukprot:XP_012649886.2 pyruvate kinase [Babesia microti strain RI]
MNRIIKAVPDDEISKKLTKIVCTIGPASANVDKIVAMIKSGMNVCRFNFSHGTHETHYETMKLVKEAMKQVPGKHIALMIDTKGPEIRTGKLAQGDYIQLTAGQTVKITSDQSVLCTNEIISITYEHLTSSVKPGNIILMADGTISFKVISVEKDYVVGEVMNSARLSNRKNVNLPGVKVNIPVIGEKDKKDILEFGVAHNMDYIAVSFVQSANDILSVKKLIGHNSNLKIISKIENVEGLINFDEILEVSDGIMIARGDLGMEIPSEKVFIAQKMMIYKCNIAGKPVITATQMLESMIVNPRPTRAEVTDVANAVLDGSDCVMLSGETANGAFSVECVRLMSHICLEAESCTDHMSVYLNLLKAIPTPVTTQEAIVRCSVGAIYSVNASCIIALTETGKTASLLAKYKPNQLIIAICNNENVAAGLALNRGVVPIMVDSFIDSDANINHAIEFAKKNNIVVEGSTVLAVHGMVSCAPGNTDMLKILNV